VESALRPPEGLVALLFTDIEGSTRLAAKLGESWPGVLAEHHAIVGDAIVEQGGFIVGTEGDSFFATFPTAKAGARAAVAALRGLRSHDWPPAVGEVRVRMGLHVGEVEPTESGYVGLEVHRAARVAAAAHGGQLLLTAAARELVGDELVTESVGLHRLKDFPAPAQLFCAAIDGRGASAFPPPQTESVRPTNLPAASRRLVGRDDVLAQVVGAIASAGERVVTITGRGGAGKTSLALVAGLELLDRHPGGVWWVDLTATGSADEVPLAIAAVVGAQPEPEVSVEAAITTRLRHSGATLVIVDNMEHMLAASGTLRGLLDQLPDLRLLVSSRLPLRVDSERVIALDALDERSGLELIGRAVQQRGKGPPPTDADGDALREIVGLLDGLPLALELAAARLSVLTAVQLRDRLRESIDVLGEIYGGPTRQRSLRAALESTLSLLDPEPRALFVRMGAYAGPVELEELERVLSGDGVSVLEALADLIDASLVQRVETGDGTVKFGLAEALRQIASELLDREGDGERWRHAHAQRQYELVWASRARFVDRNTYLAARSAEREAGAALRWATATHDPLEQPLAAAYAVVLLGGGRAREGGAITERLIAPPPADAEVRWLAFCAHSTYIRMIGRFDEARQFTDEAYRAATDAKTRSAALIMRGLSNFFGGHIAEAVEDHAAATALARELRDDPAFLAGALINEAQALIGARSLEEATVRLDEARTVGSPVDAHALAGLDTHLGDLAIFAGRPGDALEPFARSLELALADGRLQQVVFDLFGVAEALAALGHDTESLEVAGLAESHSDEIGAASTIPFDYEHLRSLEKRIGPARARELKQRGRSPDPADRVARACQLARSHLPASTVMHDRQRPTATLRDTAGR
jgi:class 3 adenylate cyclase/predicted ATPase